MVLLKSILFPALAVGGLALLFGLLLAVASKVFAVKTDERLEKIRACLPGSNCGGCGYAGCDALAAAIHQGNAPCNACAGVSDENAKIIADLLGTTASKTTPRRAFVQCAGTNENATKKYDYTGIDDCSAAVRLYGGAKECAYSCTGLGSCVKRCKNNALSIKNGVAFVDPSLCNGCGACISSCPKNLIVLLPRSSKYAVACSSCDKGAVTKSQCKAGCVGCRICEKCCPEGAIRVENGLAVIDQEKCTGCGLCPNKCPRSIIVPV